MQPILRQGPRGGRTALLLLVSLAALLGVGCGGRGRAPARPDVLLLVIDTLRADRLGCYGHPRPTSPNLDALAERGVLFEHVSSQSSWTLPSMSSMLSGKYLTALRNRPDPDDPLLAESFAKAGYRTIGIAANTLLRVEDGFGRGFEQYRLCDKGKTSFDDMLAWLDAPLAQAAQRDAQGRRRPLFLYVHAFDPHAPYMAHHEYDEPLPPRGALPLDSPAWRRQVLREQGPPAPESDPDWQKAFQDLQRQRGLYDQEVRYADAAVGRLLARIEELGLGERLVIAVVSDHGEGLWDQISRMSPENLGKAEPETFFFGGHGQDLSQQALTTPFLLAAPGLPRGLRIDRPIENIDLFPTLLHLADLPAPGGLHGHDLLPLVQGETAGWREATYSFVIHGASIVDHVRGLKLVLPDSLAREPSAATADLVAQGQLYELGPDPWERENRIGARTAEARELARLLARWMEEHPTERTTRNDPDFVERLKQHGYAGSFVGEDEQDPR